MVCFLLSQVPSTHLHHAQAHFTLLISAHPARGGGKDAPSRGPLPQEAARARDCPVGRAGKAVARGAQPREARAMAAIKSVRSSNLVSKPSYCNAQTRPIRRSSSGQEWRFSSPVSPHHLPISLCPYRLSSQRRGFSTTIPSRLEQYQRWQPRRARRHLRLQRRSPS